MTLDIPGYHSSLNMTVVYGVCSEDAGSNAIAAVHSGAAEAKIKEDSFCIVSLQSLQDPLMILAASPRSVPCPLVVVKL